MLLCLFLLSAPAAAVEVSPPVTISITVLAEPRPGSFVGDMIAYDDAGLTLDVRGGERQRFAWADLTSQSAFIARYRVVDEGDARQWLSLAEFGRAVGAERQAEAALGRALRLDPSLAAEADRIRKLPADTLRRPPATRPADPEPPQTQTDDDAATATPPPMPMTGPGAAPGALPGGDVHKFQPVTDGEAIAALRDARRDADRDLQRLGVRMRQVETPHFLIFTNWDSVDDKFLADSLEGAYRLVGREFDIPFDENVFVGKLPVFMFDAHDDFIRYAREIDGQTGFRGSVAGYYSGRSDGMGKMAMSKPRSTADVGLPAARQLWARTLTHEFTHAFFARYRSNAFVPRWLNEGLAEVVAEQRLPAAGGGGDGPPHRVVGQEHRRLVRRRQDAAGRLLPGGDDARSGAVPREPGEVRPVRRPHQGRRRPAGGDAQPVRRRLRGVGTRLAAVGGAAVTRAYSAAHERDAHLPD